LTLTQGWTYRDQLQAAAPSAAQWYADRWGHGAAGDWIDRMAAGEIDLNGRPLRADAPLRPGDRLAWRRPPWEEPAVPLDWRPLYDDGDMLVIDKPSGIPVLPAGGFLQNTVLHQAALRHPARPPRPVHRLGRGTSGLLVMARSAALRAHLSALLRERTAGEGAPGCEKSYRALCEGCPVAQSIRLPIGRRPHPTLGHLWDVDPDGAPALSHLRPLEARADGSALVEVGIETGRPHQIRVHMAGIGHPLRGDPLYGRVAEGARPGDTGYLLHAHRLRLQMPGGQTLDLVAPLPEGLTSRWPGSD
jgi:23S rRNA pseudouridine1911/1915/1917 synthase